MLITPVLYRPAIQPTNNIQRSYASNVAFGRRNDEYEEKGYKPGPIKGFYIKDSGKEEINLLVENNDRKGNNAYKFIFSCNGGILKHYCEDETILKLAYDSLFDYIRKNRSDIKEIYINVVPSLLNFHKEYGFKSLKYMKYKNNVMSYTIK